VRHSPCCTMFLVNCFGIEIVLCDLYLKRFDLTKDLLFETFLITVWYKLCRCDHSVLELIFESGVGWALIEIEYLNIRAGIILTTNELVDRIRNFKSNASLFKKKLYEKMRCRPDFL